MRHLLILFASAAVACKGDPPATPPPGSAALDPVAPAAPPATAAPPPTPMDDVMSRIVAVLDQERQQRPNPGPSVEAVFAGLDAAGLAPTATKQVVAATARARYCASGTREAVTIAVCEYASAVDAAAGRDHVRRQFAALDATRLIVITGATTVTIAGRPTADLEARFKPVLDAL